VSKGIRDLVARLETIIETKQRESTQLQAELARYREGGIDAQRVQRQLADLASWARDEALRVTRELWGDESNPSATLQGGAVWEALENAEHELRAAKTGASRDVDWARLQVETERIKNSLGRYRNLSELRAAYERGNDYERMALQNLGQDVLAARYHDQPEVGSFMANLERDREAAQATPEVEAARARAETATAEALRAWEAAGRAAAVIEGPGPSFGGGGTIRGILSKANLSQRMDAVTGETETTFAKNPPMVAIKGL
jgi:hypothetical protein